MVTFKSPGRRAREAAEHDGSEDRGFDEQNYIQALGTDNAEGEDTAGIQKGLLFLAVA